MHSEDTCLKKQSWVLPRPSSHGALVTDHWWIKAPFDVQDIREGIRVRVHLNKHVLVKRSFWCLQQIDMKFLEILPCLPCVNVEYGGLRSISSA